VEITGLPVRVIHYAEVPQKNPENQETRPSWYW
jgi:hypothetical protein